MAQAGMVDSYQGVGRGAGCRYYLIVFFTCLLFSYVLSLFLSEQNMIAVISVFCLFVFFVSGPFNQELLGHRKSFNLNHSQCACPPVYNIIRLLDGVYHISLLICDPSPFHSQDFIEHHINFLQFNSPSMRIFKVCCLELYRMF